MGLIDDTIAAVEETPDASRIADVKYAGKVKSIMRIATQMKQINDSAASPDNAGLVSYKANIAAAIDTLIAALNA